MANSLPGMGLSSAKKILFIQCDHAMLLEPPSMQDIFGSRSTPAIRETEYSVKYADNRILVYRQSPMDGMVFHVTNNGNTLECPMCQVLPKSPVIWEKIDQWKQPASDN